MPIASKGKLSQFRTNFCIHINGSTVKQVKQKKILGIIIDNELNMLKSNAKKSRVQ